MDPVHQNANGKWRYWDETWTHESEPCETEAEARAALDKYYIEQVQGEQW